MNNRRNSNMIKKERIIDLTDRGRNNTTPVVRELRSLSDQSPAARASNAINFVNEERDIGTTNKQGPNLQDPDGNYEEQLEAEGAFIVQSTTYYPASGTTVTRRSQTPAEIAEE